MRRKSTAGNQYPKAYSPAKANTEVATAVGHLTFMWNYIETALDWAFDHAIETEPKLRVDVRSRINGLEGKLAVIKKAIGLEGRFTAVEAQCLLETFGLFAHYKQMRDAVTHVRIGNIFAEVAPTFERQGDIYEALVSLEALQTLNSHLEAYQDELWRAQACLFLRSVARPTKRFKDERKPDKEFEKLLQSNLSVLQQHQATRKSLPRLPEFPKAGQSEGGPAQPPKPPDGEAQE